MQICVYVRDPKSPISAFPQDQQREKENEMIPGGKAIKGKIRGKGVNSLFPHVPSYMYVYDKLLKS